MNRFILNHCLTFRLFLVIYFLVFAPGVYAADRGFDLTFKKTEASRFELTAFLNYQDKEENIPVSFLPWGGLDAIQFHLISDSGALQVVKTKSFFDDLKQENVLLKKGNVYSGKINLTEFFYLPEKADKNVSYILFWCYKLLTVNGDKGRQCGMLDL